MRSVVMVTSSHVSQDERVGPDLPGLSVVIRRAPLGEQGNCAHWSDAPDRRILSSEAPGAAMDHGGLRVVLRRTPVSLFGAGTQLGDASERRIAVEAVIDEQATDHRARPADSTPAVHVHRARVAASSITAMIGS